MNERKSIFSPNKKFNEKQISGIIIFCVYKF